MRLIRSTLFFIYLVVYTIPYACACLIAFPFLNAHRRYWMATGWCRSTLWMLRHLVGVTWRIEGVDNLPDGPAVLLSKHQSAWETLAFPAIMPRPLCYVFKRELLHVPFFGWALGMLKMVRIDRNKGHRAFMSVVRQGKERMADGCWVIMFPEGTRVPVGQRGKYKTGGARLALASGVPAVPIAHNAGHVWPRNAFLKFPGIVTVSIGKPIDTRNLNADEVMARVEEWIETEMRRIDPHAYPQSETPAHTQGVSSSEASDIHGPRTLAAVAAHRRAAGRTTAAGRYPAALGPFRRPPALDYRLKRSARRTIGFSIDGSGLAITAPHWVTIADIEAALADKQRWIFAKLAQWQARTEQRALPQIAWADGTRLPYLGKPLTVALTSPSGTPRHDPLCAVLALGLPPDAHAQQIKDRVQGWLQQEARRLFGERLEIYAQRLGVRHSAYALSSAATRWGSCSSDGKIRLNWRLIHFPLSIVDYVVAHELAHLREMNHSPRFWNTVASIFPEFREARRSLKDHPPEWLPVL
ncbi:hypothetical protein DFQ28_000593 [Apophysomyces sp. BC1034]|nr:hypothetical protein DFQ28_000593 [Apophysomyces sp. BC1034]